MVDERRSRLVLLEMQAHAGKLLHFAWHIRLSLLNDKEELNEYSMDVQNEDDMSAKHPEYRI